MKKLVAIFTLLFSTTMFSSPAYAEWTKVASNTAGDSYYIDFTRVREHDGYIYYWRISDYLKPTETGTISSRVYKQASCSLFKTKFLSDTYFKGPMASGEVNSSSNIPDEGWNYPVPGSVAEGILKVICDKLNQS